MTVIRVDNLGKRYRLGAKKQERYETFRNMLAGGAKRGLRRLRGAAPPAKTEDFWALREVSFAVEQGRRVGIIGRNGAGKSTLLKLLSRITAPTEGRMTLKGRVGSLLEVGTGFHPELTGRENIYLNGAVLGMTHGEIRRRFDEIVAFAEVEQFLDTPVKRYSSGMYVRLAFAVAAHMEPEILIVDEVLAVGDAAFQKKCFGKMDEIGRSGRTLLFVSHSMTAITQLCDSCVLLQGGKLAFYGAADAAAQRYLQADASPEAQGTLWRNPGGQYTRPEFTPVSFALTDADGQIITGAVPGDKEIWVRIEGDIVRPDPILNIGYTIYSPEGYNLYWSYHSDCAADKIPTLRPGRVTFRSRLPGRLFNEGDYRIDLLGGLHFQEWFFEPGQKVPSLNLTVSGGLSDSPYWLLRRPGLLAPVLPWETAQ